MSQHTARTPVSDGGLDVPHLTQELQVLALKTVEQWARPGGGVQSEIGRVLLASTATSDGLLSPSRLPPVERPTLQASLTATGVQLRQALATVPRSVAETSLLQALLPSIGRGSSADFAWHRGWLYADYDRLREPLAALRECHGVNYGNLQVDALLEARAVGACILVAQSGDPVSTADFPGLFKASDRVKDIVELSWTADGSLGFRSVRHAWPLTPSLAIAFRRFCDTLVVNYPGLLRPPAQPEDLVLRPPTLDVWCLRPTPLGFAVVWKPVEEVPVLLGHVRTTEEASREACRVLGTNRHTFERHGWLDAPFALWTSVPSPTPKAARTLLCRSRAKAAAAEAAGRQRRWDNQDSTLADALASVDWTKLMKTPGAPASHRLLFHKLKGGRLSGWDRLSERRGCPHCPSIGSAGGSVFHIAWACPRAQARWNQLRDHWAPLRSQPMSTHSTEFKADAFGLRLTALPDALWEHQELTRLGSPTPADTVATASALQSTWTLQVMHTLSEIWKRRASPDTLADVWSDAQAQARHGACLHSAFASTQGGRLASATASKHAVAALGVLSSSFARVPRPPPARDPAPSDRFLLFFDGGSRGNPGPGGAGSVVVRVDRHNACASVVWTASMSLRSARTTNNQAEYLGLLTGLKAAHEHHWSPLEVIGDSRLVLQQMEHYRAPKQRQLLEYYATARRLADTIGVRRWRHHYRAHNKMADAAANVAMDSGISSQVHHPTRRTEHARVAELLAGDFAEWQSVCLGMDS